MITQYRFITPEMLNCNGTLFGGTTMQWMDEVAFIAATRISRQKMVTVSVDNLKFISPIKPDSFVEISAQLLKAGHASLNIIVEVFAEGMYSGNRGLSSSAVFKFAAVGADDKPCLITKSH